MTIDFKLNRFRNPRLKVEGLFSVILILYDGNRNRI